MSIFLTCPCLRKKSLNSIFNVVCGMEGAHSRNHKVVEGGRTKMTIIQLSFMNSLATRHARSFLCAGSFFADTCKFDIWCENFSWTLSRKALSKIHLLEDFEVRGGEVDLQFFFKANLCTLSPISIITSSKHCGFLPLVESTLEMSIEKVCRELHKPLNSWLFPNVP